MLSPTYLANAGDDLANEFYDLETKILCDIAARIKANSNELSGTAEQRLKVLQELGVSNDQINSYLAKELDMSEQTISKIISNSTYKSVKADTSILNKAVKAGLIDEKDIDNTNLKQIINDGVLNLSQDIKNICNSTVEDAQQVLTSSMNEAYLQVASGAFSPDEAVDNVVSRLAKTQGITIVNYASGAHRRVDTAVRMAVRTSINQTAAKAQLENMKEFGCSLVKVTQHMGARPDHAEWQGKVFWVDTPVKGYESLVDVTGYGSATGLCGVNCRHNFFPYVPGISDIDDDEELIDVEENNEVYQATQEQRYNERMIRSYKRQAEVKEAAGLDSTKERAKITEWKKKNQSLVESNQYLKRNFAREKGYTKG